MLAGIEEVHAHRIIHMDIKPENFVFVKGSLKLIDLGLALALPEDSDLLETDTVYGTEMFMAPECFNSRVVKAEGGKVKYMTSLGLAADVWSAGVTLLNMLPLTGEDRPDKTLSDPRNLSLDVLQTRLALEQEWLAPVLAVLKSCLLREPSARPSAAQLRQTLF